MTDYPKGPEGPSSPTPPAVTAPTTPPPSPSQAGSTVIGGGAKPQSAFERLEALERRVSAVESAQHELGEKVGRNETDARVVAGRVTNIERFIDGEEDDDEPSSDAAAPEPALIPGTGPGQSRPDC